MNKETKIGKMGRMLMLQHMIGAGEGCDGDKHERSQASVNQKSQLLAGKQGHRAEDTQQGSTSCVFSLQSDVRVIFCKRQKTGKTCGGHQRSLTELLSKGAD
ncbi:hypothetical protein QQP08_023397, partial [Theobroma cacao]